MDKERIIIALDEAKRFIKRAEAALIASEYDAKANAAMKRSSMDLTRALADVRRSQYE